MRRDQAIRNSSDAARRLPAARRMLRMVREFFESRSPEPGPQACVRPWRGRVELVLVRAERIAVCVLRETALDWEATTQKLLSGQPDLEAA